MASSPNILHLLRNTSARDIERALLRDGFRLERQTRTGGRIYIHVDGRLTLIHFHHARDRFTRKTLGSILAATGWTEDDARRLGLL